MPGYPTNLLLVVNPFKVTAHQVLLSVLIDHGVKVVVRTVIVLKVLLGCIGASDYGLIEFLGTTDLLGVASG